MEELQHEPEWATGTSTGRILHFVVGRRDNTGESSSPIAGICYYIKPVTSGEIQRDGDQQWDHSRGLDVPRSGQRLAS